MATRKNTFGDIRKFLEEGGYTISSATSTHFTESQDITFRHNGLGITVKITTDLKEAPLQDSDTIQNL